MATVKELAEGAEKVLTADVVSEAADIDYCTRLASKLATIDPARSARLTEAAAAATTRKAAAEKHLIAVKEIVAEEAAKEPKLAAEDFAAAEVK